MQRKDARKNKVANKADVSKKPAKVAKKAAPAAATRTQQSSSPAVFGQPDPSDAIALLKADHREVEKLFKAHRASESIDEKGELVQKICQALAIHARLEDEVFYPACREGGVDTDLMDEAQVEHDAAAMLVEDLLASDAGDEFHDAKVKVLGEYVQMHVREEEMPGSGIFAKAKSAGLDMAELGERLQDRKEALEMQAASRGIHPPSPRALGLPTQPQHGEDDMERNNRERDEQGRFVSDDDRQSGRGDDRRYGRSGYDDDGRSSRGSGGYGDDRGSYGRSRDDDDGRYGGGRGDEGRYGRGRDDDDRGGRSSQYRDDDRGQSRSGQGWYGDSEGHARAAERGWDNRDDRGSSSRGRDDDRGGNGGRGRGGNDDGDRGQGGWFGDSRGHSEAAQRGWETRRGDDDGGQRGRSSQSRFDDDRGRSGSDRGQGGWFGDSRGHSEAAQRGWDSRRDDDDGGRSQGSRSSRSRSDDDDRSRSGGDRGHGGWFGDSRGHSEAAQRGWENRQDQGRGR